MSDSIGGAMSDLDDMDDIEMIMQQLQSEKELEQAVESSHRRNYIYRERLDAEERLREDYFGAQPKYPPTDATGLPGFSVIIKCTSAIRQLAYDVTPDALDEYLQMGDHCARDCPDVFTMCVIEFFMPGYLRKPSFDDIQTLYNAHNTIHGFPGMLESIDCMHWEWKNCPKQWHEQFARGVLCEVVTLNSLLIAFSRPVSTRCKRYIGDFVFWDDMLKDMAALYFGNHLL
ncbi:transcription elongation factor SPT6 [Tanacetum coccineum]|uniref:Transcription elongation factor SPT6 n=1 Tax=Tanacetum coccineum TaxID=301880 RepID=A0ABQ4Z9F4_9ASTR